MEEGGHRLVAYADGAKSRPAVSAAVGVWLPSASCNGLAGGIENCFHVAEEKGGAIPVLPLTDSLRQIFPDKSSKAVDRTAFVAVQTPQTFRVEEIKKAYKLPYNDTFTDDASVYEAAGYIPELVEGNRENLKITLPVDLAIAEIGLKE